MQMYIFNPLGFIFIFKLKIKLDFQYNNKTTASM